VTINILTKFALVIFDIQGIAKVSIVSYMTAAIAQKIEK